MFQSSVEPVRNLAVMKMAEGSGPGGPAWPRNPYGLEPSSAGGKGGGPSQPSPSALARMSLPSSARQVRRNVSKYFWRRAARARPSTGHSRHDRPAITSVDAGRRGCVDAALSVDTPRAGKVVTWGVLDVETSALHARCS